MAKADSRTRRSNHATFDLSQRIQLGHGDGQALAVQLLHQLAGDDVHDGRYFLDPKARADGEPQTNLVMHYLDEIRKCGSRAMEEGFASVLSDYLASAAEGGVTDAAWYEHHVLS